MVDMAEDTVHSALAMEADRPIRCRVLTISAPPCKAS
jgi:hypothetical protein